MKKIFKLLLIFLIVIALIFITIKIINHINMKKYENEKNNQVEIMISYLASKYNIVFSKSDCIYYKAEDYSFHSDIFGNGKQYDIPYIGIFEKNNEKITVVNRKDVLSDDKQLSMINIILGDYFEKIIGYNVDFVEVRNVSNGNTKDDILNDYIQNDFNKFIDDSNKDEFTEGILKKDNLKVLLYIKEQEDNNHFINEITSKLDCLRNNKNIKSIAFYVYNNDEQLITTFYEAQLDNDYYDNYKFGYYSVNNDIEYFYPTKITTNEFLYYGFFNLDRGYNPPQGERVIINDWSIYNLKENKNR